MASRFLENSKISIGGSIGATSNNVFPYSELFAYRDCLACLRRSGLLEKQVTSVGTYQRYSPKDQVILIVVECSTLSSRVSKSESSCSIRVYYTNSDVMKGYFERRYKYRSSIHCVEVSWKCG